MSCAAQWESREHKKATFLNSQRIRMLMRRTGNFGGAHSALARMHVRRPTEVSTQTHIPIRAPERRAAHAHRYLLARSIEELILRSQ